MIESVYISSLLKDKDDERIALFATIDMEKITQTICAFLNTSGGRVLVGFDHLKQIVPVNSFCSGFERLKKHIYQYISPESLIGIREEDYQGHQIVLIEVIEGNRRPYSYKNKSYVRVGAVTVAAGEYEMSNLIRIQRKDEYSWEKSLALEATVEDLDLKLINDIIKLANTLDRSSKFQVNDPLKFLSKFQLLKNNQLTNAAIVLFAKDPVYFLPQCRIRIIEFGEGKTGNTFENTVIIEDNLFNAFKEIQAYFKKNIPRVSFFSDSIWQRADRMKYPISALDEAIINAMMHRDYSDNAGEVFIGIYKDKIEIINSGELPLGLRSKDLKKDHRSMPPNPGITHVVYLAGMIEKVGRGTILINEVFKYLGVIPPEWKSKQGTTTLTLNSELASSILNERMSKFLDDFTINQPFSREEYSLLFSEAISERTARADIVKLLSGGWLEKVNNGALTKYRKINKYCRTLPDRELK